MFMSWLWTAITLVCTSHTTHLQGIVTMSDVVQPQMIRLPGYELRNCMLGYRHHRYWLICREPVGLVIPTGIVTHIIEVTEKERHCVEPLDTGASHALII